MNPSSSLDRLNGVDGFADEGSPQTSVGSLKHYLKSLGHSLTLSICENSFESLGKFIVMLGCRLGLN